MKVELHTFQLASANHIQDELNKRYEYISLSQKLAGGKYKLILIISL